MTNITSSMDITLVTLQNCPSDLTVIHQIFDKAAELGIDIDMISLAPSQSAMSSLSFTMSDHDLPKLLTFSSHLHNELGVKTVISSGNSKIIVADEAMKNQPGFASKIFLYWCRHLIMKQLSPPLKKSLHKPNDFDNTTKKRGTQYCAPRFFVYNIFM